MGHGLTLTLTLMSKLLRIALAWLLAVALPLQGVAAQAMLTCGPAHHQVAATHEHATHDHGAATASADEGSHEHHAKAFKAGPAGKCSACASCCGAAAMTTATFTIEVIPPLHAPVVATIPAGKALESVGGLDRPPRRFLA